MSETESHPYESDSDNKSLVRVIDQLAGFGVTQQQIAHHLQVTPSHLARVKKGERHAKSEYVDSLQEFLGRSVSARRDRSKAAILGASDSPILSMSHAALASLSAVEAVEAFRDLLWARATLRGIPKTLISVSSKVTEADGGVDASILESGRHLVEEDELLTSGTRFQIKTGDATPWQPSYIKRELIGKKKKLQFESLGRAVQKMLREKKRYVLVCFGIDPNDDKLRDARKHLQSAFADCGFPNVEVEVWVQNQLIGLFSDYPSLCLRLRGFTYDGFYSHASWSRFADMQPPAHYSPEVLLQIDELRSGLITGGSPHLRLLGEAGIGKTRLALELTNDEQVAPATLYVPDGRSFLKSAFLNALVSSDNTRQVILVIDDCSERDRASIWNALKAQHEKIRVISIDHAPDDGTDDKMRKFAVPPSGKAQITQILKEYGIGENDAARWAEYCLGSPRFAHMLGENLRENRSDLLTPPAINDVFSRSIVGNDNPESEDVTLRRIVLMYVALFERFGFETPVDSEARFIAELAQSTDNRITWGRFQSIVEHLRKRRILQGAKTLYITPRILHVYLFREFWNNFGNGFNVTQAMAQMPPQLWNWFVKMLKYAHDTRYGDNAVDRVLDSTGMFPSGNFPNDDKSGAVIDVLAETSPKAALKCLQRTLGAMDRDSLFALEAPRQHLVWALEKIAVREEFFEESALLLLALAEAENAKNVNNATGTFLQLFSLIPQLAVTQAPPSLRLRTLKMLLASDEPSRRQFGVQACERALDTSSTSRTVGPEHQGLRRTIEFWMPKTYGELWAAHEDVWNLLSSKLDEWEGEQRHQLIDALIQSAWSSIYIPPLTNPVLDLLDHVSKEDDVNIGAIVSFCKRQLGNEDSKLPDEVKERLQVLCDSLEGDDLRSRLLRWVKFVTHDDTWSCDGSSAEYSQKVEHLADEATAHLDRFAEELPWLVTLEGGAAFGFAYQVGQRDTELKLYKRILDAQARSENAKATLFLTGYLGALFHRDSKQWESLVLTLADNPTTAPRFSDIVICSGMSDCAARQVITQCRNGRQDTALLERWWFDDKLKILSEDVIHELVGLLTQPPADSTHWSIAIQILHTYYLYDGASIEIPVDFLASVLIHPALSQRGHMHHTGYYWGRLANALLEKAPERRWQFFRDVIRIGVREWSALSDINRYSDGMLTKILRSEPETAFQCVAEVMEEAEDNGIYAITRWLGGDRGFAEDSTAGPIQYIPARNLFRWIEHDIETNGDRMVSMLPKTLDNSVAGRLTRDFIANYGNHPRIRSHLLMHFWTGGYWGDASEHFRQKRDEARSWLVDEDDPTVMQWVRQYIDRLNQEIERAELDVERVP